jgi:hypothetical protein
VLARQLSQVAQGNDAALEGIVAQNQPYAEFVNDSEGEEKIIVKALALLPGRFRLSK